MRLSQDPAVLHAYIDKLEARLEARTIALEQLREYLSGVFACLEDDGE